MDSESKKIIESIQDVLDRLLSGEQCCEIQEYSNVPEFRKIIKQMNLLIQNLNEINCFAIDISEGKLDGAIPPQRNYMAGPLKQLHSQLSILVQSFRHLMSGYVVSKFENTGELFDVFNELIDLMEHASTLEVNNTSSDTSTLINSWSYHQILHTLNMLHISVLQVDCNGRVVYSNPLAKKLLGNMEYITSEKTENNVLLNLISRYINQKNAFPIIQEVYDNRRNAWYQITSNRLSLPNKQTFYLYIIEDISNWKKNECKLKLSASTDAMTGAYNRKAGLEELEKTLKQPDLSKIHCLAFIDIDSLKSINDTYGHKEGDYTIKNVGKVLLSSVRSSDVVCRYGGDEFFIIFKNCTEDVAEKIIARMNDELEELNRINPKPYKLAFSHGIVPFSVYSVSGTKAESILEQADKKMYLCKTKKA